MTASYEIYLLVTIFYIFANIGFSFFRSCVGLFLPIFRVSIVELQQLVVFFWGPGFDFALGNLMVLLLNLRF